MTNTEFRNVRSKAGLTQARVAIRADVDRTRLCMWEIGDLSLRTEEVEALWKAINELIIEQSQHLEKLLSLIDHAKLQRGN